MEWIKKNKNIVLALITIGAFVLFLLYKDSKRVEEYTTNLFYMDTYIQVKLYAHDKEKANKTLEEVDKIYADYHQLTDRYQEYENVVNLYTIAHNTMETETLKLDEKLYQLLAFAFDKEKEMKGLFTINLGNVIDIWRSYRMVGTGIPSQEELQIAQKMQKELVLLDDNTILNNHVNLDLGGIAKGYVTNVVAQYLKEKGYTRFLINAGGNVVAGNHYASDVYKIGIETPTQEGGVYEIVKLTNKAVTTSGSYQRFYTYNNEIYHHIIDPVRLYPPNYMKSVTVITEDSSLGDLLSTTLFLMPIEEGIQFLKENYPDVDAIWYGMDDTITKTEGFSQYE